MEPWLARPEEGDADGAWDWFLERYRRLIFSTIRHYADDYDDNTRAIVADFFRDDLETFGYDFK